MNWAAVSILAIRRVNTESLIQPVEQLRFQAPARAIGPAAKPGKWDLVLIGDSITAGWQSGAPSEIWAKHFPAYRTLNLGIAARLGVRVFPR